MEKASTQFAVSREGGVMRKRKSSSAGLPRFQVVVGTCLGYQAYRGFAPISELAALSRADIFDVEKLQQNISACQLGIAGRNNDLATSSQFTAQTVLKALNGGTQTIEWIKPILVGLIGLRMK